MTADEIIALARSHFGEATALSVSAADALAFLNDALQELFNDLPPDRMRNRLESDAVALTAGKGSVPNTWDRIIEVYVDNKPAVQVPKESIGISDFGTDGLFAPIVPIYHFDESYVWVRPTSGTVEVIHLAPPSEIASGSTGNEVTEFAEPWHAALALLVASRMYAQEEDKTQADHYKNEYRMMFSSILAEMQEAS